MSNDQLLAELLDRFLEDILTGEATIEECLAEAPEHRAELEPLLRAAADVTAIPVPAIPAPDPARRAAFMAELRATPQQAPRFRVPSLPSLHLGLPMLRLASVGVPAAMVAAIALAFVWSSNPATASAATLTVFVGQVEAQVEGGWELLEDGASLQEGLTIRTGEGSFAMLTFPDGSTATVDASTQLGLDQIAVNGARQISLRQESGRIWNDVVPIGDGDSYVIRTPHAVVTAHGTVFETTVNGDTAVETAEGHVSLELGGRTVDVAAGQIVRASAEGIGEPQLSPAAGEIQIRGPVVAYLTSPKGAATGVLLNGLAFRQIPGIITTDVEIVDDKAQQTIVVGDASLGEYSLVLRRYAGGEGSITVSTPASSLVIRMPESVQIARLPLEIAVAADGGTAIRTLSSELESVGEAPQVRVVETERSRSAQIDTPEARATAQVAAATPATATSSSRPDPTRNPSTPSATPWRPSTTPTVAPTTDAWVGRLQDALSRDDDRSLESVLDDVLDGDDETKAARLAILAAAMSDPRAAERIRDVLNDREAEEIRENAERLVPALAETLRDTLADQEDDLGSNEARGGRNGDTGSDPPEDGNDDDDGSGDREGGRSAVPDWLQAWLDELRERLNGDCKSVTATPTPSITATATPTATTAPTDAPTVAPTSVPTVISATPTPGRPSWWDRLGPGR